MGELVKLGKVQIGLQGWWDKSNFLWEWIGSVEVLKRFGGLVKSFGSEDMSR